MPASELHEISQAIGGLQADNNETVRQRKAMFSKLDDIHDCMHEIKGAVAIVSSAHIALRAEVDTKIKPTLEDYERQKNRAIGVAAGIGLGGGAAAGGLVASVLKWFT